MNSKIWKIVLAISLVVMVISGINIIRLSREYQKGINEYAQLEQYVSIQEETEGEGTEVEGEKKDSKIPVSIEVDQEKLLAINEDFTGWLYYEPLKINYPVVRGNDNDYYTHYTFENEKNNSGAIFMDFLNKPDFSNYNTIIYGHNMRNGTMFGSLKKLLSDDTILEENPYFYIFTEDKVYMYEIFAVYITNANSQTYDLIDDEETQEDYLTYISETASWLSEKEVTAQDKIVTLSTCHGLHSNNRTVVHGVLIACEDR